MRKSLLKHLFLAFLILLSIFLSYNLWVPNRVEVEESNVETDSQAPGALVERDLHGVYSPVEYIYHDSQKIAMDPSVYDELYTDLIDDVVFDELSMGDEVSVDTFRANIENRTNTLEMVYADPIPFGILADNFSNMPSDLANEQFDRIVIDLADPEQALFYNIWSGRLTRVDINEIDLTDFNEAIDPDNYLYPVYAQSLAEDFVYLPSIDVTMERKHYTVERLPNNLYSSYFFPDPSGVELRVSNNISRYIDLTMELRINNETNVLTYYQQLSDFNELSRTGRFVESMNQLNTLENWTNHIKYDATNEQMKLIYYRRYLDHLPIFSEGETASLSEVGVLEDGLSHLKLPLTVIQTPITLDEDPQVELPAGSTLMNDLSNTIEPDHIQDMTIGVKWIHASESSQVVSFEPKWFMQVEGQWIDVDAYLAQQEGGDQGNGLSQDWDHIHHRLCVFECLSL